MRTDWVPLSASALVVGMLSLVLGVLVNPTSDSEGTAQTISSATTSGGQWLAMSVMYFVASVALTLGLPSILTLFRDRGQRLGFTAVGVFLIGTIGTAGFAMLLVFFRALVQEEQLNARSLDGVVADTGLGVFLYGWIVAFYLGITLLAVALLVAKRTPLWVPVVLLVSVAMFPLGDQFGRVAQLLQLFAMTVAFTGIAIAAAGPGTLKSRYASSRSSGSTSGTNA